MGFALQLCALRYPGRLLAPGEFVAPAVVDFIGRQLDLAGDDLAHYAVRSETRHEHLAELRRLYGFRSFSGRAAREVRDRLGEEAEVAGSFMSADVRERSCQRRRQSSGFAPMLSSKRNAGSKPASPLGFHCAAVVRPRGSVPVRLKL